MSTPMDIDPPAASAPADNTTDEVKGKGKEEKPRFEVKKVPSSVQFFFFS